MRSLDLDRKVTNGKIGANATRLGRLCHRWQRLARRNILAHRIHASNCKSGALSLAYLTRKIGRRLLAYVLFLRSQPDLLTPATTTASSHSPRPSSDGSITAAVRVEDRERVSRA
jgi:hypothetical protein